MESPSRSWEAIVSLVVSLSNHFRDTVSGCAEGLSPFAGGTGGVPQSLSDSPFLSRKGESGGWLGTSGSAAATKITCGLPIAVFSQ